MRDLPAGEPQRRVAQQRARARARPRRAPGSRCRCPSTRPPPPANAATARITGLNRAMTPGPQVVAVGEPAGQDDRGDAIERSPARATGRPARRRPARGRGPCRGRSCCPGRRRPRCGPPSQPPPRRRRRRRRRRRAARCAYASISGFDSSSAGQPLDDGARRGLVGRVDGQLDAPADAHVADALDPEVAEAALDRPALRDRGCRAWA